MKIRCTNRRDTLKYRPPDALVGGRATMYDLFVDLAAKFGDDKSYALELLRLLPLPMKSALVWLD